MKRSQKAKMDEFMEEFEVERSMEKTYSGDVDMPEDVPLIEDDYSGVEERIFSDLEELEDDEYSDDEVELFLDKVNFDESNTPLSFDDMMPAHVEESGVLAQRKENVVTPHFLVIREYVETTPSVCAYRDCFYDGSKAIGFKNWHKVPKNKQKIALAALERHTQKKHKFNDTDVIDMAQIPKSWMSPPT